MKVLVVGTGGDVVSGITIATDRMVDLLNGMEIEAVRLDAGNARRRRPNRVNLQNVAAVLADVWSIWRVARREHVDVVWYHTFGLPTLPAVRSVLVALAARVAGARAVVHLHAYGLEDQLAAARPGLRSTLRLLDRIASSIVVLYDGAHDALVTAVGARRVVVLENWVDVTAAPTPQPQGSPFIFLFVGGLVARKGVPELLDAMVLLDDDDIRLRLAGSAAEDGYSHLDHLRARIGDLESRGIVTFLGELDQQQVAAELDRTHVLVLPSRAEGTPLAMLEAMAHGRPVIVGDAGNARSVVESAGCGLVLDEISPAAIANALEELAARPERAERWGEHGYRSARTEWSANARRARVRRLVDDVTASNQGAG